MPNYDKLSQLLQQRIDVIADTKLRDSHPEAQLLQLKSVSESISAWHQENKSDIPAQLNHFLKQSSLTKAQEYINAL